jgi:type IV pilus assembly protein PilM
MAETRGVWGIDIGLSGLKAIRLVYAEGAKQVLATAFDYVPHPKILSQPDANPEELIAQALDTFLSRNPLGTDGVAIGVPGQTALARFIQLPPVEASKVGEIVKYEARQQIPFALEEVIWDYQPLGGGVEESGFMLDAEVGLFAMKRDQVQQHLAPFLKRKVEVDLIQIAPLALYNFLCHDQFGHVPGGDASDEQEEFSLVLDMGADNTTLVVSNGKKIWNRNVPLGGNHFTRALTKEMKLTFAKAEHLKCNATKSPDPKAVFQALRPVFNDYVAEIQRSIGFFSSVNRDAKIGRIVGVGNGFKLAGLQKFLQQNLQMDVERIDSFQSLAGDSVLNAPMFQENVLSFAISYGLALQGLKITRVHTSLLPPEITTARLVRKKKPWAVATAAVLLLGLATSTLGYSHAWSTVSTERFGGAETKAGGVISNKDKMKKDYDGEVTKNANYRKELLELMVAGAERTPWLEAYKAIDECLPHERNPQEQNVEDPKLERRIRIMSITTRKLDNLDEWFKALTDEQKKYMRSDDKATGPTGPGYVFTLQGRHFHDEGNRNLKMRSVSYIENTLLHKLQQWTVAQFDVMKLEPTGQQIPVRQIGITHPTIVDTMLGNSVIFLKNGPGGEGPGVRAVGKAGAAGRNKAAKAAKKPAAGEDAEPQEESEKIPLTDFRIEFAWKYVPPEKREAEDPALKKAAAAPAAGAPPTGAPPTGAPPTGAPATGAPTTPAGGLPAVPSGGAAAVSGNAASPPAAGATPGASTPTPSVPTPK